MRKRNRWIKILSFPHVPVGRSEGSLASLCGCYSIDAVSSVARRMKDSAGEVAPAGGRE